MHHLRPVRLQLLDHFLARQQLCLLLVEFLDLLDLDVDLGDLVLEEGVAVVLAADLVVVVDVDQEPEHYARQRRQAQQRGKFLLA
jgi:hypothetical protein